MARKSAEATEPSATVPHVFVGADGNECAEDTSVVYVFHEGTSYHPIHFRIVIAPASGGRFQIPVIMRCLECGAVQCVLHDRQCIRCRHRWLEDVR